MSKKTLNTPTFVIAVFLMITSTLSFAGAAGCELKPNPTNNKDYLFAFTTDFSDDLIKNWFDRDRMRKLLTFFQKEWGMKRAYWIRKGKHGTGLYFYPEKDPDASKTNGSTKISGYKSTISNLGPIGIIGYNEKRTYENVGELLPAFVEIAHELGMECYAVYKPFDLGYRWHLLPYNSPEAEKYGKLDCLSGKIHLAADVLVRLQDKRLQRHPADMPKDLDSKVIATIKITADHDRQPPWDKEELRIMISDDNYTYRPYKKDYVFRHDIVQGNRVVFLENLEIKSPYLALESLLPDDDSGGSFGTTLDKMIKIYDTQGKPIPFTYGLDMYINSPLDMSKNVSTSVYGFIFDEANPAKFDGYLNTARYGINRRRHRTGIAKGKEKNIPAALSPAYPEVRACWLNHIQECLDAGVDGVDIRTANHNKSFEWERYGFEPPVVAEYKKRYGVDITKEPFDDQKRREILGDFYTEFIRDAGRLIRSHNKKMQVHIGRFVMPRAQYCRYMNIHWQWEQWIDQGLVDEVTMMDRSLVHQARWERIAEHSTKKNIPVYWRSRVTYQYAKPNVIRKWGQALDDSVRLGQSVLVFYESASLTNIVLIITLLVNMAICATLLRILRKP